MRPTERHSFPHRRGLVTVTTLAAAYVAGHFFRASNVTIGLDLPRDLDIGTDTARTRNRSRSPGNSTRRRMPTRKGGARRLRPAPFHQEGGYLSCRQDK
jgi:hypothetical protein